MTTMSFDVYDGDRARPRPARSTMDAANAYRP
ncbi:MAG: hypothetical protein QOJ90_63, partial [Actinomycetota bacterium]|nr:hypothetical protein [Actinomycetota bacterium]